MGEARMLRLALLVAVTLAGGVSAHAQQRTNNENAPGTLRQWPVSGKSVTVLSRSIVTHDLTCATVTGYNNPAQNERYFWGIRQNASAVGLEIIDTNPAEVSGQAI